MPLFWLFKVRSQYAHFYIFDIAHTNALLNKITLDIIDFLLGLASQGSCEL